MADEGISIITLSYNRPDYFLRCAESVKAQGDIPYLLEKILVQNGSDTETIKIADEFGWKVLYPNENLSFSAGNNLAANFSSGSHLLLLNNDAVLAPGCLEALWKKRNIPILGTKILTFTNQLIHAGCGFRATDLMPLHYDCSLVTSENIINDMWCPWVTFACVLLRKDIWMGLSGLDPAYNYSFEDVDYCVRSMAKFGTMALFVADAIITHDFQGTRDAGELDQLNGSVFHAKWIKTKLLPEVLGMIYP